MSVLQKRTDQKAPMHTRVKLRCQDLPPDRLAMLGSHLDIIWKKKKGNHENHGSYHFVLEMFLDRKAHCDISQLQVGAETSLTPASVSMATRIPWGCCNSCCATFSTDKWSWAFSSWYLATPLLQQHWEVVKRVAPLFFLPFCSCLPIPPSANTGEP